MAKTMHVETHCQHDKCRAAVTGVDMFDGVNVKQGWTYWREADLTTCPDHYAYGLARERVARRANDA